MKLSSIADTAKKAKVVQQTGATNRAVVGSGAPAQRRKQAAARRAGRREKEEAPGHPYECTLLVCCQRALGDRPAIPVPTPRPREEPCGSPIITLTADTTVVERAGPSEPLEGHHRDTRIWAPEWQLLLADSILGPGPSIEQAIERSKGFVKPQDQETLLKIPLGRLAVEHTKALAVLASHETVLAKQADRSASSGRDGNSPGKDSAQQQLKTQELEVAAKLEEAEAKCQSEVEDLVQHFGREMSATQRSWKDNFLGSAEFLQ
ncbi:hypothetical protein Ancab_029096 [Ancistrocladus abbreviatus]